MLMTTQNSVSHMAYLLEPGCKRRESGEANARERSSFPTFLKAKFAGESAGISYFHDPKRIDELKSANRRRKSSSRNSR
jgi:hypothetical protein